MFPHWLTRLPVFRAYRTLQETTERLRQARNDVRDIKTQLRASKDQLRDLKTQLDEARHLTKQRDLELRLLVAPVVRDERLKKLVRTRAESYRNAEPFPHVIVDDLFDTSLLERVLEEFESMDRGTWHHTDAARERKWSTEDARQLGPFTSALIAQLNAGPFVTFLEELTGIRGLLPDPHLRGGGLHEIGQGGLLGVHADFNVHKRLKVYRRLNLLIYLNKEWQQSWGGALELWDRDGRQCVREIEPIFNRAVLFDTSNFSYHGHPHPLACPDGRSRKSVALYYYSVDYPFEEDRTPHSTVFLEKGVDHHD
jgi:hypothetical protein